MRHVLLAAVLVFFAAQSGAVDVADVADVDMSLAAKNPEAAAKDVAQKLLRGKNGDFRMTAVAQLKEKGEFFDCSRIEVAGVRSSDDTNLFNQTDFDGQIKPSLSVKDNGLTSPITGPVNDFLKKLFPQVGVGEDVRDTKLDSEEFKKAAQGEVTDQARKVLKPYKDKEINELVAHSWGCELVYAAILNGELRPPKKLIVVGVPDDDHAKWEMLAARTGTEVHWVRAENDKVAAVGAGIAKKAAASVDFGAGWDAICRKSPEVCPAHDRAAKPVIWEPIVKNPGTLGHDREAYYTILKKNHVIEGTHLQLRAAQTAVIEGDIRQMKKAALEEALIEARGLVTQARKQLEIAELEHDERLRNTLLKLTYQSCANPGSVSQADLDGLPKPRRKDFLDSGAIPVDQRECMSVYFYLGQGGSDAEEVRRISTPREKAVEIHPTLPGQTNPSVVSVHAQIPFSSVLPGLKEYAVTACHSFGQVPIDKSLTQPYHPFSFDKETDDQAADRLSAGLGNCESRLFRRMIERIRSGEGEQISPQWVQETAASYRAAPPGYALPQPGGRSDPCRDNGNIRCP